MTVKAIALCRVSTKFQEENNHSLDSQKENIDKAALELNATIVETISGQQSAKAGNNFSRKDLNRAYDLCKKDRHIKYLLIDRVNRLAREMDAVFHYIFIFRELGVTIHFCDASQREYNGAEGINKIMLALKGYEGEAENTERIQTITARMQARVRAGYYPFHCLAGYMKSDIPGLHKPDPIRFPLLKKALEDIAEGRMTLKEAHTELRLNGYRTHGGKVLDLEKFTRIAKNPYYAGIISINDWGEAKGLHVPMITMEQWEIVCAIANGRKPAARLKCNPDFPLNTIVDHYECGVEKSGCKMTGIDHTNGKGWRRKEYVCRYCRKRVPRDVLHTNLTRRLDNVVLAENEIENATKALKHVWQINNGHRVRLVEEKQREIDNISVMRQMIVDRLLQEDDDIVRIEFKNRLTNLIEQEKVLEKERNELSSIDAELEDFSAFALNFTNDQAKKWWKLDRADMKKCKRIIFNDEMYVDLNKKVYTPNVSPIYRLMRNKKAPESASDALLVELVGTAPTSNG